MCLSRAALWAICPVGYPNVRVHEEAWVVWSKTR
jgi:hypothetical protein